MKFTRIAKGPYSGAYKVYPGNGESLREVLQAIAIASFKTALPVRWGYFHYDPKDTLTRREADKFIKLNKEEPLLLHMDYVKGRACKTHARRSKKGDVILWIDKDYRRIPLDSVLLPAQASLRKSEESFKEFLN